MKKTILLVLALALILTMGVAKADFTFGEPVNLGPNVNTSSGEGGNGLSISADELSIYFESDRSGGYGNADLWVATRATKNDDWTESVNLGSVVNGSAQDNSPSISADGLSLYFSSNRSGTVGNMDLWVTTRETTADDWNEPVNLGTVVNSSVADYMSYISADGLSLYFSSERPGGLGLRDLWITTRETTNDEWGEPVNLGPTVNSSSNERRMWISSDGLMILLQSDRPKGSGAVDIYMTTRLTTNDDWTEPVNIGPPVNVSIISDVSPVVSSDGRTLYFASYARIGNFGQWDLWQAPIMSIVDLNADGIVDAADMCIVVDNWGTDNSLCDIGPMPWGDCVVDEADVEILVKYWGQEIDDPTLIAHWKLDETEETTVYDSINNIKAQLYGDPVWQPTNGMVDGALLLDGIDDYIGTWEIPDLSVGDFSMFAWIKGGAPGQVIISEFDGVNWLMADAITGYLSTDLGDKPLVSEVEITDGSWHRVGLSWNGTNRVLIVDDVTVASDKQRRNIECSEVELNIGCGPDMTTGAFFSGLIDDVRIYNRAITP